MKLFKTTTWVDYTAQWEGYISRYSDYENYGREVSEEDLEDKLEQLLLPEFEYLPNGETSLTAMGRYMGKLKSLHGWDITTSMREKVNNLCLDRRFGLIQDSVVITP